MHGNKTFGTPNEVENDEIVNNVRPQEKYRHRDY